ncbi:unnamed protein product [Gadus morhua 'NCC']
MDGNNEAGANGEVQHCPAHPNDAPVGGTGAAMATEQEGGGQQNKEPVAKKATRTTAEKVTVGHPDSTEVSNNAGLAGETVLPENSNPEQGQGDNGECSDGGTNGEAPPEGDHSPSLADPNVGHGEVTGGAQAEEQEDGVQQNGEPVTERTTNATDEKEATTDASDPEGADSDEPRPRQRPLGPAADETDSEPIVVDVAGDRSGNTMCLVLLAAVLVGLFAIWLVDETHEAQTEQKPFPQVDLFIREMNALETRFPGQRLELWKRSRIHLERHLRNARPTEPVSLILVAGRRAERTLGCLARGLAAAFSAAHDASVLHLDGAAAAGRDSDRVKMDIDGALQGAFGGGGNRPAAVIHRLEELPPGSTLIFYRYCDHENAAFKKTFLLFTVLLDEPELEAELRLNDVEELVDEQLQRKFISPGLSVAFDSMDRDKYSGLWSRISHLILPVAAHPGVERDGC